MRALIVGAGRLGRRLAGDLLHDGCDVRILDPDADRLAVLPDALAGRALHGSPLDRHTLAGALAGCDALATTTDDDALNAVVATAARRELHVPLAVALVANAAAAEALSGLVGIHAVCPTATTAREMHLTMVRSGIESELLLGGEAGVYRAEIPPRLRGRALREIEQPGRVLAVAIERGARVLLAVPDLLLSEGDVLHVAAVGRDDVTTLVRA
jgi:trk system potassium uptake protein TrkA